MDETAFSAILPIYLIVFLIGIFFISKSVVVVRQAEVMVIERWGKFHRMLKPGLHFLIPIAESPRIINWRYIDARSGTHDVVHIETDRIDMREHVIDFQKKKCITKDTCIIEVDALVYYRIIDARRAVFDIKNLPDAIELLTQSTLRNIIATLSLDETFSNREKVNITLLSTVGPDAERWGVDITRVEIQNILPEWDIRDSMAKQIQEERQRRGTILLADGSRQKQIILSKGLAVKTILEAQSEKVHEVQKATGIARVTEIEAAAEVQSIKCIEEVIENSNIRGVDFLSAINYLDKLSHINSARSASNVKLIPIKSFDAIKYVFSKINNR